MRLHCGDEEAVMQGRATQSRPNLRGAWRGRTNRNTTTRKSAKWIVPRTALSSGDWTALVHISGIETFAR